MAAVSAAYASHLRSWPDRSREASFTFGAPG
jgi:hypothetical protein